MAKLTINNSAENIIKTPDPLKKYKTIINPPVKDLIFSDAFKDRNQYAVALYKEWELEWRGVK